jgi:hypothetical protein
MSRHHVKSGIDDHLFLIAIHVAFDMLHVLNDPKLPVPIILPPSKRHARCRDVTMYAPVQNDGLVIVDKHTPDAFCPWTKVCTNRLL